MKSYAIYKAVDNEIFTMGEQVVGNVEDALKLMWKLIRDEVVSMVENHPEQYTITGEDSFETHLNLDVKATINENARGGIVEADIDICGQKSLWFVEVEEEFLDKFK